MASSNTDDDLWREIENDRVTKQDLIVWAVQKLNKSWHKHNESESSKVSLEGQSIGKDKGSQSRSPF